MKKRMMWAALLLTATATYGQEGDSNSQNAEFFCDTDVMEKALFEAHPEIEEEALFFNEQLRNEIRTFDMAKRSKRDGEPYIIPVVFHVVHNFGPENISNEQIEDAVRVMNEDFNALNPEISSVHPDFIDIVADLGIEFRLANIDPEGNCTNGIVRVAHPSTTVGNHAMKLVSPIWDRSSYLNIWVCRGIQSGAAAYANYPATAAGEWGESFDGIVSRHDYVGSIGTSNIQRAHVLTHEVGHWLNLMHLWGNSNNPGSEDNCEIDDQVEDTPLTRGWTSCNVNGESCGSHDNIENFMEYSYCFKMFTEGQKERMLAALESDVASRSSLWQEENLVATGVLEESGPCEAIFSADRMTICAGQSVEFQDQSFSNITSRFWIFEGGSPAISTSPAPQVTFNEPGTYTVSIAVGDGDLSLTEVKTNYIRVLAAANSDTPLEEGFESFVSFDGIGQWYIEPELEAGHSWEVTSSAAYSGERSAMINGFENMAGAVARLQSNTFDLSQISSGSAVMSFKYAYAPKDTNSADVLRVWAKRDCESNWSLRRTIAGANLNTVDYFVEDAFVPASADQWNESVITNIVSAFLTDEFRLMFEFISDGGNNLYIDDINLYDGALLSVGNDLEHPFGEINLYPNPSTGDLRLDLNLPSAADQTSITVYDLSGRMVHSLHNGRLPAGPQVIEGQLGHLQNGVYLVVLESGSLGRQAQRWVLSR